MLLMFKTFKFEIVFRQLLGFRGTSKVNGAHLLSNMIQSKKTLGQLNGYFRIFRGNATVSFLHQNSDLKRSTCNSPLGQTFGVKSYCAIYPKYPKISIQLT